MQTVIKKILSDKKRFETFLVASFIGRRTGNYD